METSVSFKGDMKFSLSDFKKDLRARLAEKRDADELSKALGINPNTFYQWGTAKYNGLPTIWQSLVIAAHRSVSPTWMAWGIGPTDLIAARQSLELSCELSKFPELHKILSTYIHGAQPERSALANLSEAVSRIPAGTMLSTGDNSVGARKIYDSPAQPSSAVGEDPATYIKPQRIVRMVNRREEIQVFEISDRKKRGATPIPHWLDLACGDGCDLERCEDIIYFKGLDDFKGLHSASVRGESMMETLHPGDIIVMKPFPAGTGLKRIKSPADRTPIDVWRAQHDIREGDICIVAINDEPPTLKRIHYDTRRGAKHWKMQIVADNPLGWETFQLDDDDMIVFHAKLIGRGLEKKVKK